MSFVSLVQEALSKLPGGRGTLDEMCVLVSNTGFLEPGLDKPVVARGITSVLSLLKKASSAATQQRQQLRQQQQQQQQRQLQQQKVVQQQKPEQVVKLKTSQGTKMYRLVSSGGQTATAGPSVSGSPGAQLAVQAHGNPVGSSEFRVIRGSPTAYVTSPTVPQGSQVSGKLQLHHLFTQKYNVLSPCADGVVVIAISLFPEVPGSIPERARKEGSYE